MANILGLAVARQDRSAIDVRSQGLQRIDEPLVVYCSSETHGWIHKGVELLGIGNRFLRQIAVDEDFRIDVDELVKTVAEDRKCGLRPICVVGSAGTVNTGAIDDLEALANFCQDQNLWFHVDGAFGAMACLSTSLRPLLKGLERADSVAADLHKWMYLPFEIACLIVRDPVVHTATFASQPNYLASQSRGPTAGGFPLSDRGIDLTRGFKALKAWMCMKAFGLERFGELIDQNVAQTRYLLGLIESDPNLVLLAPAPLNVVCFRYFRAGQTELQLDELNIELLLRLQESGVAMLSSTKISGKFALRFCNVNHRSRWEDIEIVASEVSRLGAEVAGEC